MMTPTRTPKRRRSEADHSRAEKSSHQMKAKSEPKKTKATKRFEKKVLKVLKEPTATGKYTQVVVKFMHQSANNYYDIYQFCEGDAAGANQAQFEFFSPRQFKDAEGILFNGKTATHNSWYTQTVNRIAAQAGPPTVPGYIASGSNLDSAQSCKVNNSSATFRFKNFSTHKMTLEMYIVSGKSVDCTTNPVTDFTNTLNASFIYRHTGIVTADGIRLKNYGCNVSQNHKWLDMWDCQKIVYQFEPGEEQFHKLQGPKNYMMDGSKKLIVGSPDNYKFPNSPGCGKFVFFRVMANIGVVSSTAGVPNAGVMLPANDAIAVVGGNASTVGGIALIVTRHYNIEAPAGYQGQNTFCMNNNMRIPAGNALNNEVDADMPFGGPNTGI